MLSKYKFYFILYLLLFPFSYGLYALFYEYLHVSNIPIVKIFQALASFVFIQIFGRDWIFFGQIKIIKVVLLLAFGLLFLFALNNYFIINYDTVVPWRTKYIEISTSSILTGYVLSSTSEEIIYRGFIQNFINYKIAVKNSNIFSTGNLIASIIMTFIHFGFFAYFNLVFAITSIVLVFVFSLISGFIMDKTKNILITIILHILVNFTHYFVCLGVLKNYI